MKGSSRGALPAVASRLAPIGRAIWRNWLLNCALAFLACAAMSPSSPTQIGHALMLALWALIAWSFDSLARREAKRGDDWKGIAIVACEELKRRDAVAIPWSDFCARVQANVPAEQVDAVQYAMDLAIVPQLTERVH